MTEVQFRKGMDKIVELKAEVLVSSVDGDYLKLPKELAFRRTKNNFFDKAFKTFLKKGLFLSLEF